MSHPTSFPTPSRTPANSQPAAHHPPRLGETASHAGIPMEGAQPPSNTPRSGISTEQFYQPIPRVSSKAGNPTSSLRLERRRIPESLLSNLSNDGSFDDRLRLYRPPPPWSVLEDTLLDLRDQETRAKQERQSAAAEKKDGEPAVVDMNSARAARVKRELERVVVEAAKRRKVVEVEDEIEQDDSRLPLHNRYSRSAIPAIPMSNLSISSSSSSTHPPQPLVNESTSRNPFRRRHRSFPTSAPVPIASASASPSSVDNDIPMQNSATNNPGISDDGPKTKIKPLVPISSLVVPTLTPEMKEVRKKEAAESTGTKTKSATKTPGSVKNSKSPHGSSHGQFDWKSWGKPA